ncbi:MAG: S1 RNA-binding domain-containing protein, partial [Treponema sp.]|nr:S1 RNA-binding domain-containing protein [Treponema sp.]
ISELSDEFVSDPLEVIKVGDVKEFTIIDLDEARRRISLSLKSDASSRGSSASHGSTSSSAGTSAGGKKKMLIVKKGSASGKPGMASASAAKGNGQRRERQNYGSDDGMKYNPFAVLLKK